MSDPRDSQSKCLSAKPAEAGIGKTRLRYKLSDLIAETDQVPVGMPLLEDWEAMPSVGREKAE